MLYKEVTTKTIKYNYDDVVSWIKAFAAKQLGCTPDELKDEDIKITPEALKQIDIVVTHTVSSGNDKQG